MTSANYRVRRATVDDMRTLRALWEPMRFPVPELEKRLTDFQLVEGPDGKALGALALQIDGRQGRVHYEAFTDFALADQLRPLLWERVQSLATNHGLIRLWTQERAPFWGRCGMSSANSEALEKLPPAWAGNSPDWLTVKLRDETVVLSMDKEFALFMEAEKQRTARAFRHARMLKVIATVIAVMMAIFVVVAAVRLLQQNPQMLLGR